jgi:LEA14-like dessication related protein
MEKKRKTIVIIVILITIFIIIPVVGVGIFYWMVEEPDVEILAIEYESMDPELQTLIFLVTVEVDNPNSISATLQKISTSVSIDGEFVGAVVQNVNEKIPANGNTTLELEFVLYEVPVITSQVVEVRIHGTATVKLFFLSYAIRIDKTQEVNISEVANQPPMAIIVHDAGLFVLTGMSVTFDGSRSQDLDGEIVLYEWDFGDGSPTETGPTVSHSFSSRGQYTVVLTVYDNWEATGEDNTVIRVIGLG